MGNRDKYELNFLPMYRYEFRIVGFVILLLLLVYKILAIIFHWEFLSNNKVINWMIAFSLIMISSSKDKEENHNLLLLRYYSGKIALTYVISFFMSLKLVEIITNAKLGLSSVIFIILALAIFQISYYGLKILTKNKKIEIEELTVFKTYLNHKKLFYFSFVASLITICLIILLIRV